MVSLIKWRTAHAYSMNSRWLLLPFTMCMSPLSINLIAVLPCTPKLWKGSYIIVRMAETLVSFELFEE